MISGATFWQKYFVLNKKGKVVAVSVFPDNKEMVIYLIGTLLPNLSCIYKISVYSNVGKKLLFLWTHCKGFIFYGQEFFLLFNILYII